MSDRTSRRTVLCGIAGVPLLASGRGKSQLSVEGYIFQQYATEQKRSLEDVIPEVLTIAQNAGYRNIELNTQFFAGSLRDRTIELLHQHGLRMPSVYVGGDLHKENLADETIQSAIAMARICQPFGCRAVVTNPDPKAHDEAKTDAELETQSRQLNRMGHELGSRGFELRVHHHTPQLENHAREWRHILRHTDPVYVKICVDVDWAYEGGFEPVPFLWEVGKRLREIHVRSARKKIWLEDVEDSDIDYRAVAKYLEKQNLFPLIVVELAHQPATKVTRPLEENLRISRKYVERVFSRVLG